ncbi:MAG: sulfatase [Planctomycetaceae bacterium]|nr:sulfatase [Planctomycetaceae bacterium]
MSLAQGCPGKSLLCIGLILLNVEMSKADDRPNVLLIVVDDLRPMLGCYGDERIRTPNIDSLGDRGVLFEHAYCQYAKCGTSRLSMLTGLRPDAVSVFSNNVRDVNEFRRRRPDAVSLPAWLKQHGYHCQSFGKIYHDGWDVPTDWSVPSSPGRENEILEIADPEHPRDATVIADRHDCPAIQSPDVADDHLFAGRMTSQVLKSFAQKSTKPRFFAVGYRRPHLPFVAPKRYFDYYKADSTWLPNHPLPSGDSPVMAWFNSDGYIGSARRIGLSMPRRPDRLQAIDWNGYELRSYNGVPKQSPIDQPTQIRLIKAYAACVTYVDAQIGRLMHGLSAAGLSSNSIIVLCSDHGWHLGEHSAWGKMTNFEVATQVPLIISVPGKSPGRTRTIAELVDLYPTVCDLTQTPRPPHLEGESLADVVNDPMFTDETSHAISQYPRFDGAYSGTAIRTLRHRYVQWTDNQTGQIAHQELYDQNTDPNETRNIAAEYVGTDLIRNLQRQLNRRQQQTN